MHKLCWLLISNMQFWESMLLLVTVATFTRLCVNEFMGWFYLYQISMYSVQFWNAYIVYGAVNLMVVIISGLLNVYMVYKNEHTIQKLTKYITTCNV